MWQSMIRLGGDKWSFRQHGVFVGGRRSSDEVEIFFPLIAVEEMKRVIWDGLATADSGTLF